HLAQLARELGVELAVLQQRQQLGEGGDAVEAGVGAAVGRIRTGLGHGLSGTGREDRAAACGAGGQTRRRRPGLLTGDAARGSLRSPGGPLGPAAEFRQSTGRSAASAKTQAAQGSRKIATARAAA